MLPRKYARQRNTPARLREEEIWYLVKYEDDENLRVLHKDDIEDIFEDDEEEDLEIGDVVSAIWLPNGQYYDAKILNKGGDKNELMKERMRLEKTLKGGQKSAPEAEEKQKKRKNDEAQGKENSKTKKAMTEEKHKKAKEREEKKNRKEADQEKRKQMQETRKAQAAARWATTCNSQLIPQSARSDDTNTSVSIPVSESGDERTPLSHTRRSVNDSPLASISTNIPSRNRPTTLGINNHHLTNIPSAPANRLPENQLKPKTPSTIRSTNDHSTPSPSTIRSRNEHSPGHSPSTFGSRNNHSPGRTPSTIRSRNDNSPGCSPSTIRSRNDPGPTSKGSANNTSSQPRRKRSNDTPVPPSSKKQSQRGLHFQNARNIAESSSEDEDDNINVHLDGSSISGEMNECCKEKCLEISALRQRLQKLHRRLNIALKAKTSGELMKNKPGPGVVDKALANEYEMTELMQGSSVFWYHHQRAYCSAFKSWSGYLNAAIDIFFAKETLASSCAMGTERKLKTGNISRPPLNTLIIQALTGKVCCKFVKDSPTPSQVVQKINMKCVEARRPQRPRVGSSLNAGQQ